MAANNCTRLKHTPQHTPQHKMNPRIEEVDDSDLESDSNSDPEEVDIDDVQALISPRNISAASSMPSQLLQPQSPAIKTSTDREKSKHYQCLYPVYFDKARTRAEGRRVGQALAVENPLAREMADAAANLGLRTVFEPGEKLLCEKLERHTLTSRLLL
jgi:signal recognition particle subunit SRP19